MSGNGHRPRCIYCGKPTPRGCATCRRPVCAACKTLHPRDATGCDEQIGTPTWEGVSEHDAAA